MKKILSERFKELAGIKPLNEQGAPVHQKTQEYLEWELDELQDRLDQLYREMEQEAEPEGGPIADEYADEITAVEDAIRIKTKKDDTPQTYDDVMGLNSESIEYLITIKGDTQGTNEVMDFLEDDLTKDLSHFGIEVSINDEDNNNPGEIFVNFSMEDNSQIKSRIQELIKVAIEEFVGEEMGHDVEKIDPENNPISELRNMAKEMGFLKENNPQEMGKHPDFQLLIKKTSEALGVNVDNTVRGGYYNGEEGYYLRIPMEDLKIWGDGQIETLIKTFDEINSETSEYTFEYYTVDNFEEDPGERYYEASFNFLAEPKN